MTKRLLQSKPSDFYHFGYETRTQCCDTAQAIRICAPTLHALDDELRPLLRRVTEEIASLKSQALSLHSYLYERPVPVDDAEMLSLGQKISVLVFVAAVTALGCLVANMTTFYLLGFGLAVTLLGAVGMTGLPLAVGHIAFEWIMVANRWLQIAVVLVTVSLVASGVFLIGQARQDMMDRAIIKPTVDSYVDGADANQNQLSQNPQSGVTSESEVHKTIGGGALLIVLATELALTFVVGLLTHLYTRPDYAAWRKLKLLGETLIEKKEEESGLLARPEIAKKHCIAGILRAESDQNRRHRPPYHRTAAMILMIILFVAVPSWAQTIEHYEVILIDTSASISRGGKSTKLFQEYLLAVRKLLETEPPNTRVWVLAIGTDSFGGTEEILNGWTPESHGVFNDDLDHARHQLVTIFDKKSADLTPTASGTDIFGALWRIKAIFEPDPTTNSQRAVSKEIWIFSDMMNETEEFPMPKVVDLGQKQLLERAQSAGVIVPLIGYRVYVYGASTSGRIPQTWMTLRQFWTEYFSTAGAELVTYSSDHGVQR